MGGAPIAARIARVWKGSADPGPSATQSAPSAAALRTSVKTLPGSATPASHRASDGGKLTSRNAHGPGCGRMPTHRAVRPTATPGPAVGAGPHTPHGHRPAQRLAGRSRRYITTSTASSKADDEEYAAIIKKFDPKASPNPNVSSNQASGVTPVLTLAAIMKDSAQPVTPAGIKQAIQTATNVTIPLSGGLKFSCNGKAIPLLKDVCSSAAAIGVIQSGKTGKVTHITVYNPTPLF